MYYLKEFLFINKTQSLLDKILQEVKNKTDDNIKVIEAFKLSYDTHNTSIILTEFTKDFFQYIATLFLENIKDNLYEDDYDKERMLIRIELFKDGWEPYNIETYLYKYIIKKEYHDTSKEIINTMYNILKNKVQINKKNKSVGRPTIPDFVKQYLKQKHLEKSKKNIELIYEQSKKYKSIKDYLLTSKDISYLEGIVKDESVLEKLRKLNLT